MVWIALGVWTAVFQVALILVVLNEAVWDADGSATVSNTVGELVDGLGLVQAGEAHVVVWTVNSDVFFGVLAEFCHESFEVSLAALGAEILGGEVCVHAGSVPVAVAQRLAMEFHVHTILFAKAEEEITGYPHLVSSSLGAFAEDLEFPLALGHFGIDAFVVDACVQTEIEVLLDDLAGDVTHVLVACAAIVWALADAWETIHWEAKWAAILIEEVFLFETEPCTWIIKDRGTCIGWVRGHAIWHHDFAHDDRAVAAGRVWIDGHWLENAVRAAAFGLLGGTTIEAPERKLFEGWEAVVFLDLGLAAEVWHRGIAVEPDVFQFVFGHIGLVSLVLWLAIG